MAGIGVITVENQTRQLTPRSTAPVFSSSTSYAVGDLVYNDGTLYKCTTAHNGVWNASHFTAVTIGSELQAKAGEIDDLKSDLSYTKDSTYVKVAIDGSNVYSGTNGAVTNNGDGTYTIGTTDYGTTIFGYPMNLKKGSYLLYGVPNGFSFLSTSDNITGAVFTNESNTAKIIELTEDTTLYLGFRDTARPTASFTIKPFLLHGYGDFLDGFFNIDKVVTTGYGINYSNGNIVADSGYSIARYNVELFRGSHVKGRTYSVPNGSTGMAFKDENDVYITGYHNTTAGTYIFDYDVEIPQNAQYLYISMRNANMANIPNPIFAWDAVFDNIESVSQKIRALDDVAEKAIVFELVNGSALNRNNANAVSFKVVNAIDSNWTELIAEFDEELPDGYNLVWNVSGWKKEAVGMDSVVANTAGYKLFDSEITMSEGDRTINLLPVLGGAEAFSLALWKYDGTAYIPLRIATDQYCIKLHTSYSESPNQYNIEDTTALMMSRHVAGNSVKPLTIFHISDMHYDPSALRRMVKEAVSYDAVDDMICTGDMTANTYGQITGWWDKRVMTCMGNHDTASYSGGSYNWTALSMADRDAYYIAPFEDEWSIVHESGTSYYYKDYADQKIRLIVIDAMLYTNAGAEATTQTEWLTNLLNEAVTNNYHVLIATHAPHGGASPVDCSFSRYGQGTMPTNADCNTPQAVIDAVASAITSGLKFVGYLCGHLHDDVIWDAEGDGKQLMYCIACGKTDDINQWKNTDMHRGVGYDCYNLVTIDTAHTLVKLVRGGGANMDDHMRPRKAICFNYSTGQIVGQVL